MLPEISRAALCVSMKSGLEGRNKARLYGFSEAKLASQ